MSPELKKPEEKKPDKRDVKVINPLKKKFEEPQSDTKPEEKSQTTATPSPQVEVFVN